MRRFGTYGPVRPEKNYVVSRSAALGDFIERIKEGRYTVIFAPRQTGKTTFFQRALDTLRNDESTYFPISLNFEEYGDCKPEIFYNALSLDISEEIENVFERRGHALSESVRLFLENTEITDHLSMRRFFRALQGCLNAECAGQRVIVVIDEFDGIPKKAVTGFLHSLRRIYVSNSTLKCPHSVSLVGVKSITQLDYDRSISPFNIQDEFHLSNFTLEQVSELLSQYTAEVGQVFAPEVIENLHKQTAGHPFLVNRFAQILTEELDIPKTVPVTMPHFARAYAQMLNDRNTNISHLLTNIRRDRRFESFLMRIASYEIGIPFSLEDDIMNELATYGVIAEGPDGMCRIVNPIYQHRILRTFKPLFNGLEGEYFPEDMDVGLTDYLTPAGGIEMEALLDNFQSFITRAGFRILQVPDTPQEYVGQHLLYAYLDQFVHVVGANMFLEAQTGRGRMDLLIVRNQQKHIVETKIWEGERYYQAGKQQLAAYLKSEGVGEGYYIVFDHRLTPEARVETETVNGMTIRSYVIPVVQEVPSAV